MRVASTSKKFMPLLAFLLCIDILVSGVTGIMLFVPKKPLIDSTTYWIIYSLQAAMVPMASFVIPAVLAYGYGYNSGRRGSFFHDAYSFKPSYADLVAHLDSATYCKWLTLVSTFGWLDRAIYRCALWGNQSGIRHCPHMTEAKYWKGVLRVANQDHRFFEQYGENWREVVRAVEREQDLDQSDDAELVSLLPKTAEAHGDGRRRRLGMISAKHETREPDARQARRQKRPDPELTPFSQVEEPENVVEEQRPLTGDAGVVSRAPRPTITPDDAISYPGPATRPTKTPDEAISFTKSVLESSDRVAEANPKIELSDSNP